MAWRAIAAGEEITTDYALYGDAEIAACGCGSPLCRGRVTPSDWQLPSFQERYRGALPWLLQQRIRRAETGGS